MFNFKCFLMLPLIVGSSFAFAVDSTIQSDRQSVDAACKAEASTAGCGAEQVGTGLLKCIHAYKKANKSFQISPGCKSAMQQLHADHKAGK